MSYSTIGIVLSLISISILQHVAVGEINKKFVPYKNPEFGFSILYPSGWHAQEPSLSYRETYPMSPQIYFGPPGYVESLVNGSLCVVCAFSTSLSVEVDNASKYLDTNTLTVKNRTAHDYALDQIQGRTIRSYEGDYVRDMPVIVGTAHILGWRVDSMYPGDPGVNNSQYVISTYLVTNGKVYMFAFGDNPLKVPETLPIMQTMLNSVQIIK